MPDPRGFAAVERKCSRAGLKNIGICKGESMTIQFLKYIVAVAETGSITEAAKQLHISQPSLSSALKEAARAASSLR